MARILILLAVVLGIFWWLRARAEARLAEHRARQAREASAHAAAGTPDASAERMVQCAQCGVHLPQGDAIAWRGLHYCRRSHLPDESRTESRTEGSDGSSGSDGSGPRP